MQVMRMLSIAGFGLYVILLADVGSVRAQLPPEAPRNDELVVVWTSGDRDVADSMVLMFVGGAPKYKFWEADKITLLIWGPSAKLLASDEGLQKQVREIKTAGIDVLACKACSDRYGVSAKLEELGVTVRYAGKDLANFIREGRHILTF
jgi:hypothetical protein